VYDEMVFHLGVETYEHFLMDADLFLAANGINTSLELQDNDGMTYYPHEAFGFFWGHIADVLVDDMVLDFTGNLDSGRVNTSLGDVLFDFYGRGRRRFDYPLPFLVQHPQ